jgi:hypothetical protein
LHWGFAITVPAAVWSFIVVIVHPIIEILLKLLQVVIQFFAEGDSIKFFLYGSVQSFTDTIALRMADLSLAVINAFDL